MFDDILERKKASPDYKTTTKKSRKIGVFRKGLVDGFSCFSFGEKKARKCI